MKKSPALLSQITFILAYFNFRIASNKLLNAACDLDGFLFCKMPVGALDVEVKVKTIWEKFTWSKTPTPGQKGIMHGKRLMEEVMLRPERGKHPTKSQTSRLKIMHLKQMYQQVKGLGIPSGLHRPHVCSNNTPHGGRRRSGTGT